MKVSLKLQRAEVGSVLDIASVHLLASLENNSSEPITLLSFSGSPLVGQYLINLRIERLDGSKWIAVPLQRPYVAAKTAHAFTEEKVLPGRAWGGSVHVADWLKGTSPQPPGEYRIVAVWDDTETKIYGTKHTRLPEALASNPVLVTVVPPPPLEPVGAERDAAVEAARPVAEKSLVKAYTAWVASIAGKTGDWKAPVRTTPWLRREEPPRVAYDTATGVWTITWSRYPPSGWTHNAVVTVDRSGNVKVVKAAASFPSD